LAGYVRLRSLASQRGSSFASLRGFRIKFKKIKSTRKFSSLPSLHEHSENRTSAAKAVSILTLLRHD
jgi:hypothetical protein